MKTAILFASDNISSPSPSSGANSNRACGKELCGIGKATVSETVSKAALKSQFATTGQNFTETRLLRANALCPDWFIFRTST